MTQFDSFPPRMKFTPIPNPFLNYLLPQISDIVELKTTLIMFELLYHKKGYPSFLTLPELSGNGPLMSSLHREGEATDDTLQEALDKIIERGAFFRMSTERDGASQYIYFLNSHRNRQLAAKIKRGEARLPGFNVTEPDEVETKPLPDIFTLYEENIGMLTPMIADELREAEKLYPASWIRDAIREAVALNKRSWRYISKILGNWSAQGKSDGTHRRDFKKTDTDKYIKGRYGHMVQR